LINGILVLLGRYQSSVDPGAVGEGPDADAIPSLRPPNREPAGSFTGQNVP
jgi:hypothetical protein